jgi:hypothetical protein
MERRISEQVRWVIEDSKRRRKSCCKGSKTKGCGKEEEIGDFMHIDLCKTKMMLGEHDEEDSV